MDFSPRKSRGRKLSMVTCYDYTFARLLSKSPIDGILVGDSAAMVMHGYPSTL
jgi:3-methyl-2-oxobutanoate hydroxymethyltransferase